MDKELNGIITGIVESEPDGIQLCDLTDRVGRHKSVIVWRIMNLERLGLVKVKRGRRMMVIYPVQ